MFSQESFVHPTIHPCIDCLVSRFLPPSLSLSLSLSLRSFVEATLEIPCGSVPIFSRTYNVVHALIQALPPLESKFVSHLGESQVSNRDRVILLLHRRYREVLQNACQDRETHVLDQFIAHAGSTTTAERQKVLRL